MVSLCQLGLMTLRANSVLFYVIVSCEKKKQKYTLRSRDVLKESHLSRESDSDDNYQEDSESDSDGDEEHDDHNTVDEENGKDGEFLQLTLITSHSFMKSIKASKMLLHSIACSSGQVQKDFFSISLIHLIPS